MIGAEVRDFIFFVTSFHEDILKTSGGRDFGSSARSAISAIHDGTPRPRSASLDMCVQHTTPGITEIFRGTSLGQRTGFWSSICDVD